MDVRFKYGDNSVIASESQIQNGKILYNYQNNSLSVDDNAQRNYVVKPIVNDLTTAIATTEDNVPVSTKVVGELNDDINTLDMKLSHWVDVTNQANWFVAISDTGLYRSFIRYNPYTKELKGVVHTSSAITNQMLLVTIPSLEIIGANPYIGVCGIGIPTQKIDISVVPRISGNSIYSSHSVASSLAQGADYIIDCIMQ